MLDQELTELNPIDSINNEPLSGSFEAKALEFIRSTPKFSYIKRILSAPGGDDWIGLPSESEAENPQAGLPHFVHILDKSGMINLYEEVLSNFAVGKETLAENGSTYKERVEIINHACRDTLAFLLPYVNQPDGRLTSIYIQKLFPGLDFEPGTQNFDKKYDFFNNSKIRFFFLREPEFIKAQIMMEEEHSPMIGGSKYGLLTPFEYNYVGQYGLNEVPIVYINTSGKVLISIKIDSVIGTHASYGSLLKPEEKARAINFSDRLKATVIHEMLHCFAIEDPWNHIWGEIATEYLAIRVNTGQNPHSSAEVGYSKAMFILSRIINKIAEINGMSNEQISSFVDRLFINYRKEDMRVMKAYLAEAYGEDLASKIIDARQNNLEELIKVIQNRDLE